MTFDFTSSPLHWINRVGFSVRKELSQRLTANEIPLTAEEWAAMMLLASAGGMAPSELADATFRDRTTVTRLVNGMVRKNLVRRDADPHDRRRHVLQVTKVGQAALGRTQSTADALVAKALGGISPQDAQTVTRVLRQMNDNLTGKPQKQNRSST